jgi:hypothetical protein
MVVPLLTAAAPTLESGYPSRLDYLVLASFADSSNVNLLMASYNAEAVPGCR